jgi:hypothetical protein
MQGVAVEAHCHTRTVTSRGCGGKEQHARLFWCSRHQGSRQVHKQGEAARSRDFNLYGMMKTLPGFNNAHISFYYSYLVANPHIGKAIYNLSFDAKMDWMVEFITAKFLEN